MDSAKRQSLVLNGISWVDPDKDMAGQVDLVSIRMLSKSPDRAYWLVSISNSTGDSSGSESRSEVVHADIFDDHEEAMALVAILENMALETSRAFHYTMPNNGWVAYKNDDFPRMLDLSHLDGIFDRLDGVFLMQIEEEQVKRWVFC